MFACPGLIAGVVPISTIVLLIVAVAGTVSEQRTQMNDNLLVVEVALEAKRPWLSGSVILSNRGGKEIRIWNTANSWGDDVVSFEVLQGERTLHIVHKPQIYTRNVPSSIVVPPGARHRLPFNLGDGSWITETPTGQLVESATEIVALYDVPETVEALKYDVWMGHARSAPVRLN
jgi:hypothetical protein